MQYMKKNNTINIIIERSLIIINRNITMNITIKPNVIIADRNYYNTYETSVLIIDKTNIIIPIE